MADRELCTGKPMKIWDCFSLRAGMCGASAVYPGQCSGSREWSHQQVLVLIRRTTPWGFYDSFFRQAFWKPTYFYSGVCPGSNLTVTLRRGEWGWCLWLLRLQGTPFLERKILLYQARELRPVGLGATPFDKETHILFASQPLSLKGFARVKWSRSCLAAGEPDLSDFGGVFSFFPTDAGVLAGTLEGGGRQGGLPLRPVCCVPQHHSPDMGPGQSWFLPCISEILNRSQVGHWVSLFCRWHELHPQRGGELQLRAVATPFVRVPSPETWEESLVAYILFWGLCFSRDQKSLFFFFF